MRTPNEKTSFRHIAGMDAGGYRSHIHASNSNANRPTSLQTTQETQKGKKMNLLKWLSGLIANPKTGQISHTKLWANVAAACMTWKFAQTPNAPEWLWWAYGAMVGGYALIKRGIAALPQLAEIKKENNG